MVVHYDDKGKFYTDSTVTEKIPVRMKLTSGIVEGYIEISTYSRVLEELNKENIEFIQLLDVKIFGENNKVVQETNKASLNRNHIIWVIKLEQEEVE